MASLYDCMNEIKTIFTANGYTTYLIQDFFDKDVSTLGSSLFPIVFLGRQVEEVDNDESPVDHLDCTAGLDLNILLNTGRSSLEADSETVIREIKTLIYNNNSNQYWCDFVMIDNFVAQLANSNETSAIYGGININCSIKYRELKIV